MHQVRMSSSLSMNMLLHDPPSKDYTPLSWNARIQIALDAARGLEYIHEHTKAHYVHRDIKKNNIFLDNYFRAKFLEFHSLFNNIIPDLIYISKHQLRQSFSIRWRKISSNI
jgi:serine/threonine protein kinase